MQKVKHEESMTSAVAGIFAQLCHSAVAYQIENTLCFYALQRLSASSDIQGHRMSMFVLQCNMPVCLCVSVCIFDLLTIINVYPEHI